MSLFAAEAVKMANLLIEAGADVNVEDSFRMTPLHRVVNSMNVEIVRTLLRAGAQVNCTDYIHMTPLRYAVQLGYYGWADVKETQREMVQLLLGAGSDINQIDPKGYSLLHKSVTYGNLEIVKILLEYGIGVNLHGAFQVGLPSRK